MGKTVISKCGGGKKFVAALALVVVLCGMDGVQGIGTLKAEAALSFPERVEVGERISLTYESGDVAKCDGCHVVFCDSEETAQQALDSVNSPSQTGNLNGYGEVGSEELDGSEPFSYYISVPDNMNYGSDSYSVDAWVRKDSKTVVDTDTGRYCYVAAYYAKLPITINYDQNYQTTPGYYDSPLMYNLSVSFSSPDDKVNVTLLDSLVERQGYELLGWSTDANATTPEYAPGAVYQMGIDERNLLLYAVWKRKPITVDLIYGPNGGVGDYITQTKTVTLTGGSDTAEVELLSAADFTRANYKLTGWLINADEYGLGDSFSFHVNEGTTYDSFSFGAVWEPKSPSSISINVADNIYDNDDIASKITSRPSRTGTVTLEYKGRNQEDSAYTTTVPSSPGDYTVRATLEETDDYVSAFDTAPLTLLDSKINVGVTYKPAGATGKEISQNKEISRKDGKWTLILLSSADFTRSGYKLTGWKDKSGKTYDLGAEYEVTKDTGDVVFEAVWTEKQKGTVDIDLKKPLYVGAEIKYDIDKNSKGDVTVEYKKKGESDEKYSKKAPTEPGKYTVRATLEETDDYTSAEDTSDFEITYLTAPATPYTYQEVKNSAGTVTDVNVIPAEGYSISSSVDGSYGASVSYTDVKAAGGSVYLKRETDKAVTEAVKLTEYTVKDSPKITVPAKIYYGTSYTVTTTALTPAAKTVSYKKADAADSTYSTTMPTEAGKYTVRLSAPASGFYAAVDEKAYFSIDYLEAPSSKATISGDEGDGGWYKSDVYIKAPGGYEICTAQGGYYSDSIKWNEKITKLYYRRTSDGATTDAVETSFDVKIDKKNPVVVFDSSLGIADGQNQISLYTDSISFTLSDDNLKTVTVNGKKYDVMDGKCVIMLDTGLMAETKTVVATDEAGNSYTFTIELIPAWRKTNVMPVGKEVLLSEATEYSLDSGTDCVIDGEGILYAGGSKFYVKTAGRFMFIAK